MPIVSPSIFNAALAPAESNLNSPVSSPFLSITGSACMHRSTTDINRLMTHSRSRRVLMIAFLVAMLASSWTRSRTAERFFSQFLAVV